MFYAVFGCFYCFGCLCLLNSCLARGLNPVFLGALKDKNGKTSSEVLASVPRSGRNTLGDRDKDYFRCGAIGIKVCEQAMFGTEAGQPPFFNDNYEGY